MNNKILYKVAKELFAQSNISNRDIFYSEYKLRLNKNPEDLSNVTITQRNLNINLPFLKEEEIYYLNAIANNSTIEDIKDEINYHNKNYGTSFSLKNFKEICSKNLNLLLNYIDKLKPKNGAIINIYPEVFTVYYLLNNSLVKMLALQGKEISKETKENLSKDYRQKINVILALNLVNKIITKFIEDNTINFNNNAEIINTINKNFFQKVVDLKSEIRIIEDMSHPSNIIEKISLDIYSLKSSLENLTPYTNLEYSYIPDILETYTNFNKTEDEKLDRLLDTLKPVCIEIKNLLINFKTCYDVLPFLRLFSIRKGFPIDLIFDRLTEDKIIEIFQKSKNKFLLSDVDSYSNAIKKYIIENYSI